MPLCLFLQFPFGTNAQHPNFALFLQNQCLGFNRFTDNPYASSACHSDQSGDAGLQPDIDGYHAVEPILGQVMGGKSVLFGK
jgi:hypothetical protein